MEVPLDEEKSGANTVSTKISTAEISRTVSSIPKNSPTSSPERILRDNNGTYPMLHVSTFFMQSNIILPEIP
jgi:hypothetical protein